MFTDAMRAEAYRLIHNRATLFWSAIFVPLASLVAGIVANLVTQANIERLEGLDLNLDLRGAPVDLGQALVVGAGNLANPPMLLFLTIGAATLFAGDYRWETWRLVIARNRRANLIGAKVAVMAALALAAMILLTVSNTLGEIAKAIIFERGLSFSLDGEEAGRMAVLFGLGLWRILQFVLVGLLAAVVSRSLLAALFVPLAIGAAQAIGGPLTLGLGWPPDSWPTLLSLPGAAYDVIRQAAQEPTAAAALADALPRALTGLTLWTFVPLAVTLLLFKRQGLAKE